LKTSPSSSRGDKRGFFLIKKGGGPSFRLGDAGLKKKWRYQYIGRLLSFSTSRIGRLLFFFLKKKEKKRRDSNPRTPGSARL